MVRITNHSPLFLVLKNKKLFPKNIDTKENTYYYNYKKLINTPKEINWNNYENINDSNNIINSMIKDIQSCIEMTKYAKPKKHNSNKIPRKDWITSAIINSCNTKEELYNRVI